MTLEFQDTVVLDGVRTTLDGYLLADARVARTGIQVYRGFEVGRADMASVRILRPEAEVFSEDSMASFAHRPVTDDHPSEMVTSRTWRDVSRGQSGGEVVRDGHCLRVPLMVSDADTIAAIQGGKRELSAGYTCDLDWSPGTTAEGEAYDAIQRDIRANHIAVVARGRAGHECRIGDSNHKDKNMTTVTLDGAPHEVTDAVATAVAKLTKAADAAKTLADAKDGEIAGLRVTYDAEVAHLKALVPDAAAMDAALTAREGVRDAAKKLLGATFDATGKSDAEIRRAVVDAKMGAAASGKSDDYVLAAFDALTHSAVDADPIRDAVRAGAGQPAKVTDAYAEYLAALASDYRNPTNKKEA